MNIYLGELFALGTATCFALTSLFFTYSSRRTGPVAVNATRLLFAVLILAGFHYWLHGSLLPLQVGHARWGWLALSSVLGLVIGDGLLLQSFIYIGPRLASLMMALVPIFSIILSWFIFGETVDGQEALGILLALGGIGWVVTERRTEQTLVADKRYGVGILFGAGAALGQASGLITARFALIDDFSAFSATLIRMFVAMVVLWSFYVWRRDVIGVVRQWGQGKAFASTMAGTIFGPVLGVWFSLLAIQTTRIGIAATLMALTPIIIIPLAYIALKERITLRATIGTVVTLGGVALIFL